MNAETPLPDDHAYSLDQFYDLMDKYDVPSIWGGKDSDIPEPSEEVIQKD